MANVFSQVTGDSIYNLLQLGEVETDKNDRPLDPLPKIISVEVISCCPRVTYLLMLLSFEFQLYFLEHLSIKYFTSLICGADPLWNVYTH